MDGFNFMFSSSCEKPWEYPCVDACESWNGRIQAYFTKERELKPIEINGISAFIPAISG